MKPIYLMLTLLAPVLVGGPAVFAQSSRIPGPEDYAGFSHFIADRNIFDPTRQPHDYDSNRTIRVWHRPTVYRHAPSFSFVGAMIYGKGMFAFFNGNADDLKKVTEVGQTIADYTVTSISLTNVELQSTDKKEQFSMAVGDALRQDDGKWALASAADMAGASGASALDSNANTDSGGSAAANPGNTSPGGSSAPSPDLQPNEILKRLMQLREQESK